MTTIVASVLGALAALFVAWAIGRISILNVQLREGRKFAEELAQKNGRLDIEREALQKHCDELRQQLAGMLMRPVIANFSDDQIRALAQAIFVMANSGCAQKVN